ncbi:MAG: hypothetical protein IKQ75_00160 [Bacteroidales bacterium]|nr:hypothetical protein [Bacteroidales bacterium]MBR6160262.1 hypothetical protein [Bacteroidales bacterium]
MKKHIRQWVRGLTYLMLTLAMTACSLGIGEKGKTQTGELMYNGWIGSMRDMMGTTIETALRMNAALAASGTEQADLLKSLFYSYSMELDTIGERHWRITDTHWQHSYLEVEMLQGQSLNEPGACMKMTCVPVPDQYNPRVEKMDGSIVYITCMDSHTWTLVSDALDSSDCRMDLTLTNESGFWPPTLQSVSLSLSGQGMFGFRSNVTRNGVRLHKRTLLQYRILEPFAIKLSYFEESPETQYLQSHAGFFTYIPFFQAGKLEMQVTNDQGTNGAIATLLDDGHVEITYRGVTQIWP